MPPIRLLSIPLNARIHLVVSLNRASGRQAESAIVGRVILQAGVEYDVINDAQAHTAAISVFCRTQFGTSERAFRCAVCPNRRR